MVPGKRPECSRIAPTFFYVFLRARRALRARTWPPRHYNFNAMRARTQIRRAVVPRARAAQRARTCRRCAAVRAATVAVPLHARGEIRIPARHAPKKHRGARVDRVGQNRRPRRSPAVPRRRATCPRQHCPRSRGRGGGADDGPQGRHTVPKNTHSAGVARTIVGGAEREDDSCEAYRCQGQRGNS